MSLSSDSVIVTAWLEQCKQQTLSRNKIVYFYLCLYDLELDLDIDIMKMYLLTKNEVCR